MVWFIVRKVGFPLPQLPYDYKLSSDTLGAYSQNVYLVILPENWSQTVPAKWQFDQSVQPIPYCQCFIFSENYQKLVFFGFFM